MAMTLEEKVAKKAKGMDKLKYNKGVAIVLLEVDETASEYECDTEYKVRVYFKSKVAIKRIGDLLGEIKFNKKDILNKFERGNISKELILSSCEKYMLDGPENIIREVRYNYANNYTSNRYFTSLDPRKPLSNTQKEYYTGSISAGEPLSDYFLYLQNSILEGNIQYIL